MNVAIIPARGGSKRIPRKNIRPFRGKPIIAYSIEAAEDSGLFGRIIVSTDDEEIAETALRYGAEIPFFRPKELADDHAGTWAVIKHALHWLLERGFPLEYACCLYATAPFVTAGSLARGLEALTAAGRSYAFTVTSFPFPIQRGLRLTPSGGLEAIWPENSSKRSQDLEQAYHDAGQFYWGRTDAFLADIPLYSEDSVPILLPRHLVQDIDTEEDWRRAELMFDVLDRFSGEKT